uniref:Uncharacterized protein n=1 Tax=Lepeophtheirus salmonis TaxID=72036 RepID=A0A0K2V3L0_LEPSM
MQLPFYWFKFVTFNLYSLDGWSSLRNKLYNLTGSAPGQKSAGCLGHKMSLLLEQGVFGLYTALT